jgi:large subunit ribosomal protein L10
MIKTHKIKMVKNFTKWCSNTKVFIVLSIKGATAENLFDLRRVLFANECTLKIAKNTLVRKAIEDTHFKIMQKDIKEQVAIISSEKENPWIFKVLKEYTGKYDFLSIKSALYNRNKINTEYMEFLAKLTNINETRIKMLSILLNNPKKVLYTIHHYLYRIINILNHVRSNNGRS